MDLSIASPYSASTAAAAGVPAALAYEQTAALTFHNVDYLLHASIRYASTPGMNMPPSPSSSSLPPSPGLNTTGAPPNTMPILVIEAEQRSNGSRWSGEFSAKYIEEMSLKTGNFKKFTLFLKMLSSALSKSSEHVFIDLLTFEDLEALKVRKMHAAGQPPPPMPTTQKQQMAQAQNKRYMILTYVVEFDKVHYPLPLKFEMDPSPTSLKQTIARLRGELDLVRQNASHTAGHQATIEKYKAELYRLAEENHRLKSQLSTRPTTSSSNEEKSSNDPSSVAPSTSTEAACLLTPLELESLHNELRTLRSQLETKHLEHTDLLRQMSGLMQGMPIEQLGLQMSLDNMSKQVWNLQSELRVEQQLHSKVKIKSEKEQEVLMEELERRLEAERLLRAKCRRVQEELEEANQTIRRMSRGGGNMRSSGSTDSLNGARVRDSTRSSLRGPASRRPLSATSPSPTRGSVGFGSGSANGRSPAGSRPSSRPSSANSSRAPSPAPSRGSVRESSRGRDASTGRGGVRSRSPSPSLSNGARFDPSAYVKHKAEQLAAAQKRTSMTQQHARTLGGAPSSRSSQSHHSPMRSSSPSSIGRNGNTRSSSSLSHTSSPSSQRPTSASASSSSKDTRKSPMPPRVPRPASAKPPSSSSHHQHHQDRRSYQTESDLPTESEDDYADEPRRNKDISDSEDDRRDYTRSKKDNESIDERFSALQNFLKQQKVDG